MKISHLVGERTKNVPADASSKGYANLLKAGYVKQVSNGIFSLMPPARRIISKIEQIIREEMNSVDGQEVLFPVVMPKELWEQSGRYYSIGNEMVRFKDRNNHDMVLGMTHEEAAVHMAKNTITSYNQLPVMIYQIQTKFRDEPRARGGLIRVKEFTMKDAYSFHETQEDLDKYYDRVHEAYNRIFTRIGMKNFISVYSDTGMMGGTGAHEFMLLTDIGEDTLVICPKCGYKANMEVAKSCVEIATKKKQELKLVETGDAKTIDEVSSVLGVESKQTCKAVCYQTAEEQSKLVICFVRGDMDVNEAKLKNFLKVEIKPADLTAYNLFAGNIGPCNLPKIKNCVVVCDDVVKNEQCLVVGANVKNKHYTGFCAERDIKDIQYADISKVLLGSKCICCGEKLTLSRGVEIGNIFKLGTKYTKSMNMLVQGKDGKTFNPIMGCYGIGLGRSLACVAEESSDDKGLVWPISIAPWQVYLCPLRYEDEQVKQITDELYNDLQNAGVEVLLDDRVSVSAGFKFTDSELMGMPYRFVISPKTLEQNSVEVVERSTGNKELIKLDEIKDFAIKKCKIK